MKDRSGRRDIYHVMYRWEINVGEPVWQWLSLELPRTSKVVLPVHLKPNTSFEPLQYPEDFEGKTLDASTPIRAKFRLLSTCLGGFDVLPLVAVELNQSKQIDFKDAEALKYLAQQNYRLRISLPKITTKRSLYDMHQWAVGATSTSEARDASVRDIRDRDRKSTRLNSSHER